jgi:hypothetical protein
MSLSRIQPAAVLIPSLLSLCILLPAMVQAEGAKEVNGYGPWTLGMKPAEVEAVAQYGPYTKIQTAAGGLETVNGDFEGQKAHVAFQFRPAGLYQIQIRLYQGEQYADALAALHRAYLYLGTTFGPLNDIDGRLAADLDPAGLSKKIGPEFSSAKESLLPRLHAGGTVQVHTVTYNIVPVTLPDGRDFHAELVRSPELGRYYVFLYFRAMTMSK